MRSGGERDVRRGEAEKTGEPRGHGPGDVGAYAGADADAAAGDGRTTGLVCTARRSEVCPKAQRKRTGASKSSASGSDASGSGASGSGASGSGGVSGGGGGAGAAARVQGDPQAPSSREGRAGSDRLPP